MNDKLFRFYDDRATGGGHEPIARSPGKSTLTQQIARARPAQLIVMRVESAEAARELAGVFGPRDDNGVAAGADAHLDRAAGSAGAPLPGDLRERFESSLGADLSGVRVHTGAESATAADAVGAKAYTTGNDIHFAAGQYTPSSSEGALLIAHEVAHTVQQSGGVQRVQRKAEVSTPGDDAEVEADRAAAAMVAGQPAELAGGSGVQRKVMREPAPADATSAEAPATGGEAGTDQAAGETPAGEVDLGPLLGDARVDVPDANIADPVKAAQAAALDEGAALPPVTSVGSAEAPDHELVPLEIEKEIKLNTRLEVVPLKLTAIKVAAKLLLPTKPVARHASGSPADEPAPEWGAGKVGIGAFKNKGFAPKIEVEKLIWNKFLDVKLKATPYERGGSPKISLEVGGQFGSFELAAGLDPAKPLTGTLKLNAGASINALFKKQIQAALPQELLTQGARLVAGPDVSLEIAPDYVDLGVKTGKALVGAANVLGKLAPPLAIGLGLYELAKGYTVAIVDQGQRGRIESLRESFARGYAETLADLTAIPPSPPANAEKLFSYDWQATLHQALEEYVQHTGGRNNYNEVARTAGAAAVLQDVARLARTTEAQREWAEKIAKRYGFPTNATNLARFNTFMSRLRAQVHGDQPIGIPLG